MIKLLHELLLKLIIVLHAILIVVKLRVVLRIEILLIEILVIALHVELLLNLWARCAIFTHGRFIVLNTSSILRVFPFAIFQLMFVSRAPWRSLTWGCRARAGTTLGMNHH